MKITIQLTEREKKHLRGLYTPDGMCIDPDAFDFFADDAKQTFSDELNDLINEL
jgi:hypothetical protein